jgi:hypothetical protein
MATIAVLIGGIIAVAVVFIASAFITDFWR